MITRLEVDGFKSLREFAVDLEPLTVFIGPNSAGKSNILDALALLSRLSSMPIEEAFRQGRGRAIDQFTRRGGEAGSKIRFAVELFVPQGATEEASSPVSPNRVRYELSIERRAAASGVERLTVESESLRVCERATDRWVASHPSVATLVEYGEGARDVLRQVAGAARERRVVLNASNMSKSKEGLVPCTHTAVAAHAAGLSKFRVNFALPKDTLNKLDALKGKLNLPDRDAVISHVVSEGAKLLGFIHGDAKDEIEAAAGELASYRLIHLDSARLRDPSERLGSDTLAPDASNLPTVLVNLPGSTLGAIRVDLVSLVPGISTFEIVAEGDAFRIDFELSGGERLPARLVSDGTLRMLALLTALRAAPRAAVIGVEEPENGVYPGRLRKLLDYLREIAAEGGESDAPPTQLILTTHSPVVLAALRARPSHLRFVDLVRRDGQLVTRARTVGAATATDRGKSAISLREIDELLHAADSEIGA